MIEMHNIHPCYPVNEAVSAGMKKAAPMLSDKIFLDIDISFANLHVCFQGTLAHLPLCTSHLDILGIKNSKRMLLKEHNSCAH